MRFAQFLRVLLGLVIGLLVAYVFYRTFLISPLPDAWEQRISPASDVMMGVIWQWNNWLVLATLLALFVLALYLITGWQILGKAIAGAAGSAYVGWFIFAAVKAVDWGFGEPLPTVAMLILGPLRIPAAAPETWPGWLAGLTATGGFLFAVIVLPVLVFLIVAIPFSTTMNLWDWITKRKHQKSPSASYWRGRRLD